MTLDPTGSVSFVVLLLSLVVPQQRPITASCRPASDLGLGYISSTCPFPTANTAAAAIAAWFCLKYKAGRGAGVCVSVLPVMLKQPPVTIRHLKFVQSNQKALMACLNEA